MGMSCTAMSVQRDARLSHDGHELYSDDSRSCTATVISMRRAESWSTLRYSAWRGHITPSCHMAHLLREAYGAVPEAASGTVPIWASGTVPTAASGTVPIWASGAVPIWASGTVPVVSSGTVPIWASGTGTAVYFPAVWLYPTSADPSSGQQTIFLR